MDNFDFNDIEEINDKKLELSRIMSEISSRLRSLVVTEENIDSVKKDFKNNLAGIDYYLAEDEVVEDINLIKVVIFFKDRIKQELKEKGIYLDT